MDQSVQEKVAPAKDMLEQHLKNLEEGAVVTYEEMIEICGLDVREYRHVIESVKKRLVRSHNRVLVNLRGNGYKVGEFEDIITKSKDRRERNFKQNKIGQQELNTQQINLKNLSEDQKKTLVNEQLKHVVSMKLYKVSESPLLEGITIKNPPMGAYIEFLLKDEKEKE